MNRFFLFVGLLFCGKTAGAVFQQQGWFEPSLSFQTAFWNHRSQSPHFVSPSDMHPLNRLSDFWTHQNQGQQQVASHSDKASVVFYAKKLLVAKQDIVPSHLALLTAALPSNQKNTSSKKRSRASQPRARGASQQGSRASQPRARGASQRSRASQPRARGASQQGSRASQSRARGTSQQGSRASQSRARGTSQQGSKASSPHQQATSKSVSRKISGQDTEMEGRPPPRISKSALLEAFNDQTESLEAICTPPIQKRGTTYRKQLLRHRLGNLQDFLENAIRDPYMDYRLKLDFGDILDLLDKGEGFFPHGAESFAAFYQDHFHQPSNREPNDWPHAWAGVLFSSIKCAHATSLGNTTM